MVCPGCGTTNQAGRKFCSQCGIRLAAGCPECGAPFNPGDLFCGECGQSVGGSVGGSVQLGAAVTAAAPASRAPTGGPAHLAERRHVSVLFADLVGFTTLSESRDPEAVRDLLTRYFERSREIIGRYGGAVEKFIGDAVMAVWGAPIAHEDDAERAVRAALELIAAVNALGSEIGEPGLALRAGVMTGEAVVTVGATGQGMVAGDLVNTASRVQSVAPPGAVLVGEATMRAASRGVSFEPVGEQALKGKVSPVAVWRALRVVAMLRGANRSEALEPPFVGRDTELSILKELLHASDRERRTRLVSIIGPAGIGKSRLAWEFHKYIDGVAGDIYWHQGRSPAYGEGVTFWALGEMVRKRAGLAESDDPATTRDGIRQTVAEYVRDGDERRWIEPRLLQLLGVEDAPAGEREELFAAWRTFFERVAERGPVVLLFEDLHWADQGLLDFIDHLLEWSRAHPILVVALARPELLERRSDWGLRWRNSVVLSLEPLPDGMIGAQLEGLVPGLPRSAVEQILERADGIPLYAVEIVRMLLHDGRLVAEAGVFRPTGDLSRLEVPESLQALIAARLDRLDPTDRALLQEASVLGLSFTVPGLAAIAGTDAAALVPRLGDLARREFLSLNVDPRSPERGQYSFVHRLIREVAYGTLSKRDRRGRHLAAARYFETLDDDELAGILASHYLDAYRSAPEGEEGAAVAAQARVALRAAAERAIALHSNQQALAFLEQALEVVADPAERAELLERAGGAASFAGRYELAEKYLRESIDAYRAVDETVSVARATARLGERLLTAGHVEPATELVRDALVSLGDGGPDRAVVALQGQLARAYMRLNESELSLEWAERALVGAERLDLIVETVEAMITRATTLGTLGRHREGVALMEGALRLAEEHQLATSILRARLNLSNILWKVDPRTGLAVAREGVELAERVGHRGWYSILQNNAIACAMRVGDWDWALEQEAEVMALGLEAEDLASLGDPPLIRVFRGVDMTAELERLQGLQAGMTDPSLDAAVLLIEASWALVEDRYADSQRLAFEVAARSTDQEGVALLLVQRAAAWSRDVASLRTVLQRLDAAGLHGPAFAAQRRTGRASLAALEGRQVEAVAGYREAADAWRSLGLRFDLAMCLLEAEMLGAVDSRESALAADEARTILTDLRAAPLLQRLDDALAASRAGDPAGDRRETGATAGRARSG